VQTIASDNPPKAVTAPALLTALQLAAALQVSPRSIAYWKAAGIIPAVKVGHHLVRYSLDDVLDSLKRRSRKGAGMR